MKSESFTFTSKADGLSIAGVSWRPDGDPKAVIQIAHGMAEHCSRYGRFAEALCAAGYAVYANDHRGHGALAADTHTLGDFGDGGWDGLVADMVQLTDTIKEELPGKPVILFGHSMGSFAAQQYILDHSAKIDALILSGSSALDKMAELAASGVDVSFDSFNAQFAPARTDFDWLSRDPAEVDAYVADALCGFEVKDTSLISMMMSGARTGDTAAIGSIRKDLPMLIFAGALDPVHGDQQLLNLVVQRYNDAGIEDVEQKYYPEGRHEMLNETNRDEVTSDIIAWLETHL